METVGISTGGVLESAFQTESRQGRFRGFELFECHGFRLQVNVDNVCDRRRDEERAKHRAGFGIPLIHC